MKNTTRSIGSIWGGIGKIKPGKLVGPTNGKLQEKPNGLTGAGHPSSAHDTVDLVDIRGVNLPVSRRCTCVTTGDITGD